MTFGFAAGMFFAAAAVVLITLCIASTHRHRGDHQTMNASGERVLLIIETLIYSEKYSPDLRNLCFSISDFAVQAVALVTMPP